MGPRRQGQKGTSPCGLPRDVTQETVCAVVAIGCSISITLHGGKEVQADYKKERQ